MKTDLETRKSRGFGFVVFGAVETVDKVILVVRISRNKEGLDFGFVIFGEVGTIDSVHLLANKFVCKTSLEHNVRLYICGKNKFSLFPIFLGFVSFKFYIEIFTSVT